MKFFAPAIAMVLFFAACIVLPASAAVYYSTSTPQIITKGDAFTVSGTGAENGTVALWVIGRNYFEVRSTAPDRHGNFSILFKPTETVKFSPGQYAIVLQDPGPSGIMEIEAGKDSARNLTIMNKGKIIIRGTKENLQGNVEDETEALVATATLQGVDDTFLPKYFFVEEPAVHFNEIIPASGSRLPDLVSGQAVRITGTTNMGRENTLEAELRLAGAGTPVLIKDLAIVYGHSLNTWSYVLDEPGLEPGNYEISVGWTKSNKTGTGMAKFSVRPEETTPPPPVIMPPEAGELPLPRWLDTLLVLGIIFVFAVVLSTIVKK